MPPRHRCACGCGRFTAGGRFLPGHNTVARYAASNRTKAFWSRVKRGNATDCWPWISRAKHPYGYGMMRWHGPVVYAHRIAYELTHGPIRDGLSVLHKCENPACCNPTHLKLGGRADKMRAAALRRHTAREVQRLNLSEHAVLSRLQRGWTVERAFTTPVRQKTRRLTR